MGWSAAGRGLRAPPSLEHLRPDLSIEARAPPLRERQRTRSNKSDQPPPVPRCFEGRYDSSMIPFIHHAIDYYNARHPGAEFNIKGPLNEASVHFKGHLWWHLNFLAHSRNSNKVRRFFAEVHYDPGARSLDQSYLVPIPIVESCTIIEEPLERHRTSCAFCSSRLGIWHPMGDRPLLCGNEVRMAPGPAELLRHGKPLETPSRVPGTPASPETPSGSAMPPWMPAREDAIKAWDAMWASNENAWDQILHILPSHSQSSGTKRDSKKKRNEEELNS